MYLSSVNAYRFKDGRVNIVAGFSHEGLDSKTIEVTFNVEPDDPIIPTLDDLDGLIRNKTGKMLEDEDVA